LIDYQSNRRVIKPQFAKIANDISGHNLITVFLTEAKRILRNDTAIYVFCSWHKIDFFKQEFESLFTLKNIIVWNKNNHGTGDLKGSFAPKHEFILFGHKGRALNRGRRLSDVIDCAKIPSSKLTHPTEKPMELLEKLISNNTAEGQAVFDPFCGTGSTAIACLKTNRNYIGIDISPEYCALAEQRIAQHVTTL
jgi:site-specific DNA-methyltransferase (adenine-specific)